MMKTLTIGRAALSVLLGLAASSCADTEADDAVGGTQAVTAADKAAGYVEPSSWTSYPKKGALVEPLNMILTGNSDIKTPGDLLAKFAPEWTSVTVGNGVKPVGSCMDPLLANLNGTDASQGASYRPAGCANVLEPSQPGGTMHNHLKGWVQKSSGAWFMSVSEEYVCSKVGVPPVAHCIDDKVSNGGFNAGREDLEYEIRTNAAALGFQVVDGMDGPCPAVLTGAGCLNIKTILRVPGKGQNNVPYDGAVAVITVKVAAGTIGTTTGTSIATTTPTTSVPLPTTGSIVTPTLPSSTIPALSLPSLPVSSVPRPATTTATTPVASRPVTSTSLPVSSVPRPAVATSTPAATAPRPATSTSTTAAKPVTGTTAPKPATTTCTNATTGASSDSCVTTSTGKTYDCADAKVATQNVEACRDVVLSKQDCSDPNVAKAFGGSCTDPELTPGTSMDCANATVAAANPSACADATNATGTSMDCANATVAAANPSACADALNQGTSMDCSNAAVAAANPSACADSTTQLNPGTSSDCSDPAVAAANPSACANTTTPAPSDPDNGYAPQAPYDPWADPPPVDPGYGGDIGGSFDDGSGY